MKIDHFFKLKRPCANCPFLKEGGIHLQGGRLQSIKASLLERDDNPFMCHKTTYATGGGDNEAGDYEPSGSEKYCAGAMAFLYSHRRLNVVMRLGIAMGALKLDDLEQCIPVIDVSV